MKKYSFILCIALVAFVVASCGLKGNHTSSGRAYELLVVVDHGVWDRAAGRALHDALDADMPGLPQSEPSFRIMYTSPKDYDSTLKLIRNIIIVDIQDIYTKASFKYAKDVYANPQMILTIQAPNEEEFEKFLLDQQNATGFHADSTASAVQAMKCPMATKAMPVACPVKMSKRPTVARPFAAWQLAGSTVFSLL